MNSIILNTEDVEYTEVSSSAYSTLKKFKCLAPILFFIAILLLSFNQAQAQEQTRKKKQIKIEIPLNEVVTKIDVEWGKIDFNQDPVLYSENIEKIVELGYQLNLNSFDEFSLRLIKEAEKRDLNADRSASRKLATYALMLSKNSGRVALAGAKIFSKNGLRSYLESLKIVIFKLPNDIKSIFKISDFFYAILLCAVTTSLYLLLMLALVSEMSVILSKLSEFFPILIKGTISPIILLTILIVPIFFGVLWCLLIWSLILIFALKRYTLFGIFSGLIIFAWGNYIPVRLTNQFLEKDILLSNSIDRILGSFVVDNQINSEIKPKQNLDESSSDDHTSDVSIFSYAEAIKYIQQAEWDKAKEALSQSAVSDNVIAPYVDAEKANIEYINKNYTEALEYLEKAKSQGLNSTQVFMNLSKIKFAMLNFKGSLESLEEIGGKDINEELKEDSSNTNLKNYQLTSNFLKDKVKLYLQNNKDYQNEEIRFSSVLMYKLSPFVLRYLGLILIVIISTFTINFEGHSGPKTSFFNLENEFLSVLGRYMPGGEALFDGRLVVGLLINCCFVILACVALAWPLEMKVFMEGFSFFRIIAAALLFYGWILFSRVGKLK